MTDGHRDLRRGMSLNGSVGGDHLLYVDFKRRFDLQARER